MERRTHERARLESVVVVGKGRKMLALMSPRLWAAVVLSIILAFAGFTLYRAGKASVRAEWNAQKLVDAEAARKAEADARRIESERQAQVMEASNAAKKRETSLRADAASARGSLDRLRNAIRAASSDLPGSPGDAQREPSTEGRLLASCAAEYQRMGESADQHASDVQTLMQSWPKP